MDKFCYSNNGLTFRMVAPDYSPVGDEKLFATSQNSLQLAALFPSYTELAAKQAAMYAGLNALAAGVNVTFTSTPSLSGLYDISSTAQANLNAVITYILINNTFPGGLSVLPWKDMNGNMKAFSSVSLFKQFATALADYTAQVTLYKDSGGEFGPLPSNSITI